MINTFKRFEVRPALKSKGGSLRDFKGKLKFVEAVDYQIACGKSYSVAWYVFAIDVSDMSWRLTKADSEHGARAIANMLTASLTPTPAPIVHGFDEGTTITALCIWEEMLLRQGRADSAETLKKRWDDEGAYAMRQLAISMTPALETLFRSVPQWEGVVTFDWEWIPAALDCYDWDKETFQPDARAKLLERFPVAGLKIVTRR